MKSKEILGEPYDMCPHTHQQYRTTLRVIERLEARGDCSRRHARHHNAGDSSDMFHHSGMLSRRTSFGIPEQFLLHELVVEVKSSTTIYVSGCVCTGSMLQSGLVIRSTHYVRRAFPGLSAEPREGQNLIAHSGCSA